MPELSDRSLLIIAPDGTAVWVRLPTGTVSPLEPEDLQVRLTPRPEPEAETLKTVIAQYGLERTAVLTIRTMVERLSLEDLPVEAVAPVLDDIVHLASRVFALRSREFNTEKAPVGDFRQILYWFKPDGYGIGTSLGRGFFVTDGDQALLDRALYYAGIDEGPVLGLWPKDAVAVRTTVASPNMVQ